MNRKLKKQFEQNLGKLTIENPLLKCSLPHSTLMVTKLLWNILEWFYSHLSVIAEAQDGYLPFIALLMPSALQLGDYDTASR